MIRQVTAGFLVTAAKTHFQAGSGEEAGEGRETRDTAEREGSKQAWPLQLEERGRAAGSSGHPAQERAARGDHSSLSAC